MDGAQHAQNPRSVLLRGLWRDAIDGWVVTETHADGSQTGQALPGLHEDLLTSDPGGRDGAGLWQ
ncbi:hypothetical protein AB0I51_22055 [Streptomyces sp. NPDC050549]|uniref:hypothetical protein n=1 Tax=Streptomyces sp. NPDC050549 TaxID=3155406 RepID=UPI003412920C